MSLPDFNAASKSLDIPMLKSNFPDASPHLLPSFPKDSVRCVSSEPRVSFSFLKSEFSLVPEATSESSSDPMVIKPSRRSLGHSETTCLASETSSDSSGLEIGVKTGRPDLESSPDVFT